MWDRDRRRRLRWAVVIAVVLALPGASGAQAAGLTPQLVTQAGYGTQPIGFARTVNGRLHIAYETNTSWGDAASGVGVRTITPSGKLQPAVQALAWGSPSGGSPNGVPGLAVLPTGALQAVFGGSPSGVDGPWGISSTDGGATWSAPVNVGSGMLAFGDSNLTLQVSQGTPVLTAGCCGNVVVQRGFGPGAPTYQVTNAADGAAGNTASALDAKTGAVVASWDSNAGSGGIWLQQIAPAVGAAQKAPIPSSFGTGAPLILAGRDHGPGVYAAYPADGGPTTHVRLLRYGGGSVAVGSVSGLRAPVVGVATGPDGRIWVMWAGQRNGRGVIALTRSNRAVTRFEPIQIHRAVWSSLFSLSGDGRLGPLDLLMSGISAPKSGPTVNGIYYARARPQLSATVSAKKVAKSTDKLTVSVTDAGDDVSGAFVSAQGQTKQTNSKGMAKLTVAGSAGDHVKVTVTDPGYASLTLRVSL